MNARFFLSIVLSLCVLSCNSENKKKESIQLTKKENTKSAQDSDTVSDTYQNEIIASIFDQLRSDGKLNKGKEDFIVQEKIDLNGEKFKYLKVTIPKFNVLTIQSDGKQLTTSDLRLKNEQQIALDTTLISGRVNSKYVSNNLELLVTGTWDLKASVMGEYDVLYQREFTDTIKYAQSIDLTPPKKYTKEDFYLKARIMELKNSDLSNFSKEELSYLRNEIFARYGHVFKTDKMKSYFGTKSWYIPLFTDATELINEIEKKNIQLIKKLESL